ncbi:MAG: HEAT repeat domain-containing protein [Methylococcaceae bacterium]
MSLNKLWLTSLLILASGLVLADENKVQVTKTNNQGSKLQLEGRKVPLKQVLDKLMKETGVRIHYSGLSKELVTTACVGTTVKQVMKYLSDRKADVIFRSHPESANELAKNDQQSQPEEIWILGTTIQPNQQSVLIGSENCAEVATPANQIKTINADKGLTQAGPDDISKLVEMAKMSDAVERADAISLLAMAGEKDDAGILDTLENALSDGDANVRAQAVFSLAQREGSGAATMLQSALHDKESAVRLMVVDSAGNNVALLQQALTDNDETVRELAKIRLTMLIDNGVSPK